jgi:hypothetical protein|nr:MAG TPA: hypothetical protein [Caudoviricetes sp.]
MDGYEKTPTLGLNKPEKGDFDWDLPLNENWDILDRVGGAQLPLLATIDLDYKLSGDAAIGWALAGSTLSGNTYTSLWDAMKAAYDRSTAANETHYNKTYSVRIDAVTGWRFVTTDVYNSASSAIGESLGHVLDTNAKTIRLRTSWQSYDLPTHDTRFIGRVLDEALPNVKGEFYVSNVTQDFNGQQAGASKTKGMFKFTQTGGTTGAAWNPAGGIFTLNASTLNTSSTGKSPYADNVWVRPQSKNLLRYYKVGNTITNVENINVGNVLKELQALSVNSANVSLSNVSSAGKQTAVGWGMPNYKAGVAMTSPYTTPKAGFIIGIHNLSDNGYRSLTINSVELYNTEIGVSYLNGQSAGFCYPVAKGDIVSWTNFKKMTFYPNKGV